MQFIDVVTAKQDITPRQVTSTVNCVAQEARLYTLAPAPSGKQQIATPSTIALSQYTNNGNAQTLDLLLPYGEHLRAS